MWWCLNEGRTPSTRGEPILNPKFFGNVTTKSHKRVRISPRSGPFPIISSTWKTKKHEERAEDVKWWNGISIFTVSFFDIVLTRIRLASTMSRNTYQEITSGSSNIWGFGPAIYFELAIHQLFERLWPRYVDRSLSSRWRDYGIFQSFPLSDHWLFSTFYLLDKFVWYLFCDN